MALSGHFVGSHWPAIGVRSATAQHTQVWWRELLWVGAAMVLGFALTAIVADWLELSRSWVVLAHACITIPLSVAYVRWSGLDISALLAHHWKLGVIGGFAAGALVVMAVLAEDATARPDGIRLIWDLVWLGVVYGFLDALLLNVLPVLATWRAFALRGWTERWPGMVAAGLAAIAASLLVTVAYHFGYPEFRGSELNEPLIGNTVMSIGYVLSNNPITAFMSHIAMHVAAVWQGAEGVPQLPPHY
jgi:multidrug transporter EmrE-like cation transporter